MSSFPSFLLTLSFIQYYLLWPLGFFFIIRRIFDLLSFYLIALGINDLCFLQGFSTIVGYHGGRLSTCLMQLYPDIGLKWYHFNPGRVQKKPMQIAPHVSRALRTPHRLSRYYSPHLFPHPGFSVLSLLSLLSLLPPLPSLSPISPAHIFSDGRTYYEKDLATHPCKTLVRENSLNHSQPLALPPALTYLSLGSSFNQPLDVPPSLTNLSVGDNFNHPLTLPQYLVNLHMGNNFNRNLLLPPDLKQVHLGSRFCSPVIQLSLPGTGVFLYPYTLISCLLIQVFLVERNMNAYHAGNQYSSVSSSYCDGVIKWNMEHVQVQSLPL